MCANSFYHGVGTLLAVACLHCCGFVHAQAPPAFTTETPHAANAFVDSIGVNTHINYYDTSYGDFPRLRRQLKALGVRHVRDGGILGQDDYNRDLYGRWMSVAGEGIRFNMCIDPRGSLKTVTSESMLRLVRLPESAVESVEGPNELDVSGLPQWPEVARTYQRQIFSSMQQAPPDRRIAMIGPSMAFVANGKQVGSLSEFVTYGNFHPYPGGHPPFDMLKPQIAMAAAIYPSRRLVITETGYHNAIEGKNPQPGISEAAAAKYTPRLLMETFNAGIVRTYLYEFEDERADASNSRQESHWGLLRSDGTEKPAFIALQNLISILSDDATAGTLQPVVYAVEGNTLSIHRLLLEKTNGSYYLALWQEVSSYDTLVHRDLAVEPKLVTIALQHPFHLARIYDPLQDVRPRGQVLSSSAIAVSVPDHVVLVEIQP